MEFIVLYKTVSELETIYKTVNSRKYYCAEADENKRKLKDIDHEISDTLRIVIALIPKYSKTKLAKRIIQKCRELKICGQSDLIEINRIHQH